MTRRPLDGRLAAGLWAAALIVTTMTAGCRRSSPLEALPQARQMTSDLLARFSQANDAGNRAVMADRDDMSVAFAKEAEQAKTMVEQRAAALDPVLDGLGFSEERRLLNEFLTRFAEYKALDQTILALAVENTNIKAQRLAFGPAREAADAFRDALEAVAPSGANRQNWQVAALVARAVAAVREIEALQPPHIAEAEDAVMSRLEQRMATSAAAARTAVDTLASILPPAAQRQLSGATADLDRFVDLNAQIVALSRRNTNVRSLALSLNQKGKLTAACEESLHALSSALASRGFAGTR